MPLQGGGPREPATRGGRRQTRDGDSTGRDGRWRLLLGWPVRPAPRRSVRQAVDGDPVTGVVRGSGGARNYSKAVLGSNNKSNNGPHPTGHNGWSARARFNAVDHSGNSFSRVSQRYAW